MTLKFVTDKYKDEVLKISHVLIDFLNTLKVTDDVKINALAHTLTVGIKCSCVCEEHANEIIDNIKEVLDEVKRDKEQDSNG